MIPFLTVDDIFVGESQSFAEFVIRLSAATTSPVTVAWRTGNYTANGTDFVNSSGSLTFAPGQTVATVRIQIANDTSFENTEAFVFELYNASNNVTLARPVALGTIVDNDAASGTPVVSINDFVIDEAAREATFVITLNRPSTGVVSMNFATQNGTALAGSDYVAASGSLSFAPGETVKTIKVQLTNDALLEAAESFNLVLSNLVGSTTLDPVGTATIDASDATAVAKPNALVEDVYVGESQTFADFVVRLDAPTTSPVTIAWRTGNYTADGSDLVNSSGFLTFAAGETVKTVRIPIINDTPFENTEAFVFELYNASNNVTLARPVALGTIVDNDAASGTPVVSINDFVIDEAAREATFVITLNRPSTGVVSMNFATQNGTALAGSDYVAASGSLSFAPGETVKTIKVQLTNDALLEAAESFNLVLSNLVGSTTLDPVGTATIDASDATAVAKPNALVEDVYVGESQTFADFVVRLDAPTTSPVTIAWRTGNYTADGSDLVNSSGFLTFAAGETVKTVRIPIINDTPFENTEAFVFELYNASNNVTLARPVALGTIVDNDAASGTPVVSINDFVIDEAAREATFVITLNRPSTGVVSMNFATQNGTALAGSDYVAASGSLSFAPGETVKTIKVQLTNDALLEAAESFNLVLSNLVGSTTLDPVGTAVIGPNDSRAVARPTISAGNTSVTEDGNFAVFLVSLSAPGTSAATVAWRTGNGTANGTDLVNSSGFLTFAAGETVKTVRIPIVNDTSVEGSETFTFELYSQSSNLALGQSLATATIIDNDGAAPPAQAITGTAASDILFGSTGADSVSGGNGNDFIFAGAGNDTVNAGGGADTIFGGLGNDTIDGSGGTDTIDYSDRTTAVAATLNGATNAVVTVGGVAEDTIRNIENIAGGSASDALTGSAAANILTGHNGNDTLDGGAGNDTLYGGLGNDVLKGGTNSDVFVFGTTLSAATNVDTILDFSVPDDTVRLDRGIFSALASGAVQAADFVVGAAATTSTQNLVYNASTGALFYDADGVGGAAQIQFASLGTNLALTANDFLVG